jgi:hypothetical protein
MRKCSLAFILGDRTINWWVSLGIHWQAPNRQFKPNPANFMIKTNCSIRGLQYKFLSEHIFQVFNIEFSWRLSTRIRMIVAHRDCLSYCVFVLLNRHGLFIITINLAPGVPKYFSCARTRLDFKLWNPRIKVLLELVIQLATFASGVFKISYVP